MSQFSIITTTFVLIGWVISLCFHEFSHALIAYWGGDTTIKDKGYLTLNPLKYTDPLMSIILPLVFLFFGGLPLPGAAVYIEEKRLRSRWWRSGVALAGPLGSAIAAVILACFWHWLLAVTPPHKLLSAENLWGFWFPLLFSLAFLVFLNLYVMLLNLLPIPPLDGYRILEPWLPEKVQRQFRNFGLIGLIILFVLLFNFPPLSRTLFNCSFQIGMLLGVDPVAANTGRMYFEFSSNRLILSILLLSLALPILWRAVKLRKHFLSNTLEIIGFFLQISRQFKPALACYNKAIEINPTTKEHTLWMNRGVMLFNLKQYEEAICSYDKAIEIEPTDLDKELPFALEVHQIWTCRGQALTMLNRYDEAIACYDRALKLHPDFAQALLLRGITLFQAKQDREAVQTYDRLLKLQPKNVQVLLFKGSALTRLKQYDEALISYDLGLKLQPSNSDIWNDRAVLMKYWQRYEEALFSYKRALKFNPNHRLAKCGQAFVLIELNRLDEALKLTQQLEKQFPNDPSPLNIKGAALSRMGRAAEAIASYDRAIQLKPDEASTWYNKACHHAETEELTEAISNLQRALELHPDFANNLATDKSFDRIRDREEFQQLLKN